MNTVILTGRLTDDPVVSETPGGKAVAKFTLAVPQEYLTGGERGTDFIDIKAWENLARSCQKSTGKGLKVMVRGSLHTGSYDDSQGIRRKSAEVVADWVEFCERKKEDA